VPLYRSFINRFGPAESAVAASIPYYESHHSLSREGDKTDIFHFSTSLFYQEPQEIGVVEVFVQSDPKNTIAVCGEVLVDETDSAGLNLEV
jgi:hypothetical protein